MSDDDRRQTKAQRRMIRIFVKHGVKRFRILRSAETGLRTYRRKALP